MTVYEPVTLLTDGLLAALAGWLAWRLHRQMPSSNLAARWWSRALGLSAVSAIVGGSFHGLAPNCGPAVAEAWWMATLLIMCLLSAAMALSLLHELVPVGSQGFWRGLIGLKLAVFAGTAITHPVFLVAIIDYGLSLLAWTVAALALRRAWRDWMLAAFVLSAIAALAQQAGWDPSPHFNHNDIYHVIQALAIYAIYRAVRRFSIRTAT